MRDGNNSAKRTDPLGPTTSATATLLPLFSGPGRRRRRNARAHARRHRTGARGACGGTPRQSWFLSESRRRSRVLASFAPAVSRFAPLRRGLPSEGRLAARGGRPWRSRSRACSTANASSLVGWFATHRRRHRRASPPPHWRVRHASGYRRFRAEPLPRLLRERARQAGDLRLRPHSPRGIVVAGRCRTRPMTSSRTRSPRCDRGRGGYVAAHARTW